MKKTEIMSVKFGSPSNGRGWRSEVKGESQLATLGSEILGLSFPPRGEPLRRHNGAGTVAKGDAFPSSRD
jgi:hypothetical protein